jgi:hypothetical protein
VDNEYSLPALSIPRVVWLLLPVLMPRQTHRHGGDCLNEST